MKKLAMILMGLLFAMSSFAGTKKLADGTLVMWENRTETIKYNDYRVTVKLDKTTDQNVWGEVTLVYNGKVVRGTPLFIRAGERSEYSDFDNLDNGIRYDVVVKINNK